MTVAFRTLLDNPWTLLVIRVLNGGIFFLFGLGKAVQPHQQFYEVMKVYDLLPHGLIPPVGSALIYLDVIIGALLVVGLFTRFSAWAVAGMLVFYMVVILQAVLRGIPLENCGCAGGYIELGTTPPQVLARDAIMLASMAWFLAARAKSALQLDGLFASSSESGHDDEAFSEETDEDQEE
jgi:uncharacterized membrane protein YphA (DoxX/SURF4 family)